MGTRSHVHEEFFDASPEEVFRLLHVPSAIRSWWSADRAIVQPFAGGRWNAAWGADEDAPDYLSCARIAVFEPPRRMVLDDWSYVAKEGGPPFEAEFETEFTVTPEGEGARLRVEQRGFPAGPEADAWLDACRQGWTDTFAGIRRHLGARFGR